MKDDRLSDIEITGTPSGDGINPPTASKPGGKLMDLNCIFML